MNTSGTLCSSTSLDWVKLVLEHLNEQRQGSVISHFNRYVKTHLPRQLFLLFYYFWLLVQVKSLIFLDWIWVCYISQVSTAICDVIGTSQQIVNMFIHCSWCNEHFSIKVLQHIRVCTYHFSYALILAKISIKVINFALPYPGWKDSSWVRFSAPLCIDMLRFDSKISLSWRLWCPYYDTLSTIYSLWQ